MMINKKNIDSIIIKEAIQYYKKYGFPYVDMTPQELLLDYKNLIFANPKITKRYGFMGETYYSVGCGLQGIEFCKNFMPHQFKVKVNGTAGSPYDAFKRDRYLKKAIEMSIRYTGKINDAKLRSYLSRVSWHQFATNFRPLLQKQFIIGICVLDLLYMIIVLDLAVDFLDFYHQIMQILQNIYVLIHHQNQLMG